MLVFWGFYKAESYRGTFRILSNRYDGTFLKKIVNVFNSQKSSVIFETDLNTLLPDFFSTRASILLNIPTYFFDTSFCVSLISLAPPPIILVNNKMFSCYQIFLRNHSFYLYVYSNSLRFISNIPLHILYPCIIWYNHVHVISI